jgi:hypothetical protein
MSINKFIVSLKTYNCLYSIFCVILFFFLGLSFVFSQENPEIKDIKVLYKKEMSGSFVVHTNGLGINFRKGNHITGLRKGILEVDLVGMKHNKEVKSYNPNFNNPKGFIFGKMNSLTILRTGYGFLQVLNEKPYRGGVELGCLFAGGLDVGFLKPIYVIVYEGKYNDVDSFSVKKYKYDIDPENIYGKASFIRGFDEIKLQFGFFTKLGFNFDFGSYYEFVKALQVGTSLDIYLKPVPIMALTKNNNLFLTFYLSLNFGKRYN